MVRSHQADWCGRFSARSGADGRGPSPYARSAPAYSSKYLEVLTEGATEGYLQGALDGPGAVCVRHLSGASALSGEGLPPALVGLLQEALEGLKADLDLYVRHNTPEGKDEPWGEERDAPHRAVKRMVGQRRDL